MKEYQRDKTLTLMRRLEMAVGAGTVVLGIIGLGSSLLAPIYHIAAVRGGAQATASLLEMGIAPLTWGFLSLMAVSLLGVGAGAYLHGRSDGPLWLVPLWVAAELLAAGAVLTGFSIGLFFLPAAALSLVTCLIGTVRHRLLS